MKDLETFLSRALAQRTRDTPQIDGFRKAAILVPILRTPRGYEILLTVRAAHLKNHAGEIAFPGGRVDNGETLEQAAIREAYEEVGLVVSAATIAGLLDDAPTPARYMVTPVVAILDEPAGYTMQESEVGEVFTASLEALLKTEPRAERRVLQGHQRTIYFYPYGDRMIWGFTGVVLKNLFDVMADVARTG
jgi:8-oxo-dGTP pyrophosphatase MutT (NUDIX family)